MAIDSTALEDFTKAKRKAKFQGLMSALSWKNNDLMSLYEVTSIIKPKSETYLGMRTIPVSKIIGSEGRYHDFSSAFMPKREQLKTRWVSVDTAIINDIILPPISVYSLGGYYFVRDGNHRVSVAKAQGLEFIDAEVVELDSEIELKPGITMKELRTKVVEYERKMFIGSGHPLAHKEKLTPEDLKTLRIAYYSHSSDHVSSRYAPYFGGEYRLANRNDILDLVIRNEAVFIQAGTMFQHDYRVRKGMMVAKSIPIEELDHSAPIVAIRAPEISLAERLFWEFLVENFSKTLPPDPRTPQPCSGGETHT